MNAAGLDPTQLAATIFAAVTAVVIGFQIALALGAPWGAYAMGGAFPGRYPPRMRVAAIAQAVILGVVALVVLAAARIVLPAWAATAGWLVWIVVALLGVGVVLNGISRSAGERRLWVPVTVVLLLSAVTVALTRG